MFEPFVMYLGGLDAGIRIWGPSFRGPDDRQRASVQDVIYFWSLLRWGKGVALPMFLFELVGWSGKHVDGYERNSVIPSRNQPLARETSLTLVGISLSPLRWHWGIGEEGFCFPLLGCCGRHATYPGDLPPEFLLSSELIFPRMVAVEPAKAPQKSSFPAQMGVF